MRYAVVVVPTGSERAFRDGRLVARDEDLGLSYVALRCDGGTFDPVASLAFRFRGTTTIPLHYFPTLASMRLWIAADREDRCRPEREW